MAYKSFLLASICFLLITTYYYIHLELRKEYSWDTPHEEYLWDDQIVTVATYNIRYGKGQDGKVDIVRTIDKLKMIDAHIISLQEVERYSLRSGFQDQVKRIAKELDMYAFFSPSISLPGLYYGNAILSVFPIQESKVISFESHLENRTAILTELSVSESNKIIIINTHLALNVDERAVAIGEIKEVFLSLDQPLFLTGDLNSTPKQLEYAPWNEILLKSTEGQELSTYYKNNWQIDYIFHSPHFTVEGITVHESATSDHFPLVGMFQLTANE